MNIRNFFYSYTVIFFSVLMISCSSMVKDMKTMEIRYRNHAPYTVNYYFEIPNAKVLANETDPNYIPKNVLLNSTDKYYKNDRLTKVEEGKIGDMTQVFSPHFDGYKPASYFINQQVIRDDGKTEVNVYYDLDRVYVTFDMSPGDVLVDGVWKASVRKSDLYGSPLEAPVTLENAVDLAKRDGYDFIGWEPEFTGYYPKKNTTYTAKWKKQKSQYKVIHEIQNLYDETVYDSVVALDWTSAEVDHYYSYTPPAIEGCNTPAPIQIYIEESKDKNIKTVRYTRKRVSLVFDPNDENAKWPNDNSTGEKRVEGFVGASISRLLYGKELISNECKSYEPKLQNKSIVYWTNSLGEKVNTPAVLPNLSSSSEKLTAVWEMADAKYKVRVYYEDPLLESSAINKSGLNGNYKKVSGGDDKFIYIDEKDNCYVELYPNQIEDKNGKIGNTVSYPKESIELKTEYGYDLPEVIPTVVTEDGEAFVVVLYPRKDVTIEFNLNGGKIADKNSIESLKGKSGSRIVSGLPKNIGDDVNADDYPKLDGYEFVGWCKNSIDSNIERKFPECFPVADVEYIAKWNKTHQRYVVKYQEQEVSGEYSLIESFNRYKDGVEIKDLTGRIGEYTTLPSDLMGLRNMFNYDFPEIPEGFELEIINRIVEDDPDNYTVAEINYNRKKIIYIFDPKEGIWISGEKKDTQEKIIATGLYGQTIGDIGKVERENWTFWKWRMVLPEVQDVISNLPMTFGTENRTYEVVWFSNIIGSHINTTDKDIQIVIMEEGTLNEDSTIDYKFEVDIPYTGSWSFQWYIDGIPSGTERTLTEKLTLGKHLITVFAIERDIRDGYTGIENQFSKQITITVK